MDDRDQKLFYISPSPPLKAIVMQIFLTNYMRSQYPFYSFT